MKPEILNWICCPVCKGELELRDEKRQRGEIEAGALWCRCGKEYHILRGIPRFVEGNSYAENFGFEWRIHRKTQLDSHNRNRISEEAFAGRVDFPLKELAGKRVLDVGCGMGRYTEVALKHQATVIAFDLSEAIDVARENLGGHPRLHLIQADVLHPPFREESFDFIYSYGMLHHTPDPEGAFSGLPPLLKEGGKLSLFVYSSYNKAIWLGTNVWRKITTRLPKRLLYALCFVSVPLYHLYRIPVIGHVLKAVFLISMEPNWRWRLLDTFDWYSPKYQYCYTHAEVFRWFQKASLGEIKIFEKGVTLMGTKGEKNGRPREEWVSGHVRNLREG